MLCGNLTQRNRLNPKNLLTHQPATATTVTELICLTSYSPSISAGGH